MVGDNVRAERSRRKLSQEKVAKHLGITRLTYINKENNKIDFTAKELINISELLHIGVNKLFEE